MKYRNELFLLIIFTFFPIATINTSATPYEEMRITHASIEVSNDAKVSRAIITTRIEDREPSNNLSVVETDFTRVYFFTELKRCVGCDFTHEWWFNDEKRFEKKAQSKYPRYRWWSSVTLSEEDIGEWTVKILVNKRVHKEQKFIYKHPTKNEKQMQGIRKRIEIKTVSECEEKIRYFLNELESAPNDPYYQFMLDKWTNRCIE